MPNRSAATSTREGGTRAQSSPAGFEVVECGGEVVVLVEVDLVDVGASGRCTQQRDHVAFALGEAERPAAHRRPLAEGGAVGFDPGPRHDAVRGRAEQLGQRGHRPLERDLDGAGVERPHAGEVGTAIAPPAARNAS